MGPVTPEALGASNYVSKIFNQRIKWTKTYLPKSKRNALSTFQSFMQSVLIPSGFLVEHLRVDKGDDRINKDFKDYSLQMGVLLKYTSTNMSQQIGMPERVGRALAAIVRSIPADSGLPKLLQKA